MAKVIIDMGEVEHFSLAEITQSIRESQASLAVLVPCPTLSWPRSNIYMAYDYLKAIMIGDAITPFCQKIRAKMVSAPDYEHLSGRHTYHVRFDLTTSEPENLAKKLIELSIHFKDDPDMDEQIDAAGEFDQYEHDLFYKGTEFPEFADSYLANWMCAGSDSGMDHEDWESLYSLYPERRYGFWKSFHSRPLGFDFYVSEEVWILPHDANLSKALRTVGNFKGKTNLLRARRVALGEERESIQHNQGVYFFPQKSIDNARRCAHAVFVEPLKPLVEKGLIIQGGTDVNGRKQATAILRTPQGEKNLAAGLAQALDGENTIKEVLLSEEGTVLVVRDGIAQYGSSTIGV